jgi:glyoxylase-like metal-dependent hydrolase (beta-lactamase superfamily II)
MPSTPDGAHRDVCHSYRVGDIGVTVIPDGYVTAPLPADFVQNASLDTVRRALAAAGLSTQTLTTTFAPLVLKTAGRKVLLDTGLGPDLGERTNATHGLLTRNMRGCGIAPEDIGTVVISHFHSDHVNGLVSRQGPVFANAEIAVPDVEWRFWMDDDERTKAAPGRMQGLFENNRRIFDRLRDRVRIYRWDEDVVPGLTAVGLPGHSIGHTGFWLRSGQDEVFVQSDLTNHAALFLPNPRWFASFDQFPEQSVRTRLDTYEMLASKRVAVQAYHHPFPGRCFIEKRGDGFVRIPIP